MFILGTSSVLALVPIDRIDPHRADPAVLAEGFRLFGRRSGGNTTIVALCIASLRRACSLQEIPGCRWSPVGWAPAAMVYSNARSVSTPVNSIVFVGAVTLAFSVLGLIGVASRRRSAAVEPSGISTG
jgi:hypothetical protein